MNHTKCSLTRSEYSVSLAGGGDNSAASGNTRTVRLYIAFGGRTVCRSGSRLRSFDLSSIGRGSLAEDVSFFCSCNIIPAALFTTFGPVTFVNILFRLSYSLWKTKLFPVTVCGVKYVSASSIALAITVFSSKPKEYDLQWQRLLRIVVSCLLL